MTITKLTKVPEGWRKLEGANTAPKGYPTLCSHSVVKLAKEKKEKRNSIKTED